MLKLLIVDDEQIEREGLIAILRKGFPDLVMEQAKNGRAAVEMVPSYRPDLVLMDIKMPGMSGLEAVELIGSEYPDIKFIMVTAYDTFEYARKALKLGVKDYLLKPSKAGEIIETVGKALGDIERERTERKTRTQEMDALRKMLPIVEADVVTQLLFDHVHEVHLDEMVGLLGARTAKEAFVMLMMLLPGSSADAFYASVKDKMRQLGNGWVGAMSGRQIPLIVFREPEKSYRSQAASVVQQLLAVKQRVPGTDCFIGIGNPYGSFGQIRLSYREALFCSADPGLPSRHRFFEDMPPSTDLKEDTRSEKRLPEHVRFGEWDQIAAAVSGLIGRYETAGAGLVQVQQRVLESLWVVFRTLLEMGVEADRPLFSFQVQDYRQLRTEAQCLLERMKEAAQAHRSRLEPDAVHEIKRYIQEHSQEEISLETIAKRVGLSPFYISKMFKEQLGVNYIDFLTECRIEKAKTFMLDPEFSLKEIAFEVGYNDPNYFSKVFKKTTGVAPTDYRNTLLGKKV
ncbi:response regulator [Cohnella sp. CFH 77786]|uniref:response regulator n=1 Tax=Cohnella sp. CFH 77786 TaxID=2662265 RepID=UPI001C60B188|nr:response regulator [Cohnella sp. CFH 77786]MBW5447944.1 response regulator [Cohnella sp. CFH 77786]